jgi:hypothetical protein
MTANTLTTHNHYVGYSGGGSNATGAVAISGGTFTVTPSGNGFYLGLNATDRGSLTLSGTGTLVSNTAEFVGQNGAGTFTQTGGINTLMPGFNFLTIGHFATGAYNLSGGSLTANQEVFVGKAVNGTFNQTGGYIRLQTNAADLSVAHQPGSKGLYTLPAARSRSRAIPPTSATRATAP